MMPRRTIRIVAVVLAAVAAVSALVGYDVVYERRITDDVAPRCELF